MSGGGAEDQKPAARFPSDRPVPGGPLAAVWADLWDRLEEAAARGKPAFHLPTLATVDAHHAPAARVVVLRHADRAAGVVGCHTDARSPKAAAVLANPAASWCFYDRPGKVQVRVSGGTKLIGEGPEWEAAWAATSPSARRCYLGDLPPGTVTDTPEANIPAVYEHRDPTDAESEPGRRHFRLLRTTAGRVEWLSLAHAGHRRALFTRSGDGWASTWAAV